MKDGPELAFGLDFSPFPHRYPSPEKVLAPVSVFHPHPIHQQELEVGFLGVTRIGGKTVGLSPPLGTKKGSPGHPHSSEDAHHDVLEHFVLVDAPCLSDERHGLGSTCLRTCIFTW